MIMSFICGFMASGIWVYAAEITSFIQAWQWIMAPRLKNVLPLVQNDNYSEPKLVCRQLFSHVYEDIKSVYTFFQFLSQQISK